ncbi:MAG: NAD-dependent epimerase/dehydratase family protein [Hyphomonadaceae bacterium]|nr:NAD-dependent epimerase/dehydratase family protein [Hyphomonadaceae bacterium]
MRIFVTGASGFVGGAATQKLVSLGHDVRAMSRSGGSDAKIKALGAAPVRCDLETIAPEHVGDAEIVLHCAAYVEAWGPRDAWYKGNVLGTRNVLAASTNARRFIHIGTEAAIVHGQHIVDADETYPLAPNSPFPYCATKAQAEQFVRDARGIETIVLRPRFIWGPGDTTLLPIIETMAKSGGWMWVAGGRARTSTTHIDNLVHAIALALKEGRSREAYFILDDGERTMKEMISGMAAAKGFTLPDRSVPAWLADAIGAAGEAVWRTFNLKGAPPLTRHAAMVMGRDCVLNGSKARRELGYAPQVGVEEGLRRLTQA